MRLLEILEQLAYGELSTHSIGNAPTGGISPDQYARIIPHINLALTALYKRYPLKVSQVTIRQFEHITNYYLHTDFAESNLVSTKKYKYIDDSVYEPFTDDVLGIDAVHNEMGQPMYLNDDNAAWSVQTPEYNCISIPLPDPANSLHVTYRAKPPRITGIDTEEKAAAYEINLPPTHLEALLYFVGSRYLSNRPTLNGTNDGILLMQRYEQACLRLSEESPIISDNTTNMKLRNNGWV